MLQQKANGVISAVLLIICLEKQKYLHYDTEIDTCQVPENLSTCSIFSL